MPFARKARSQPPSKAGSFGIKTLETDPATFQTEKKSDSGFSAGVYARGGIDIIFTKNFMLAAGVRGTQTGLSFSDTAGKVDVEGWQYFGVITFRF